MKATTARTARTDAKATPAVARLAGIAETLGERQRSYLLTVHDEDQRGEAAQRQLGPNALPAHRWRWIEYGPVGAKWLDQPGVPLLRRALDQAGLVDQGTGATWSALVERGLVQRRHVHTGFMDFRKRPIASLMLRMTPDGRKVARILTGAPLTKPKPAKQHSLSALRLITYGQARPETAFGWSAPWDHTGFVPDYLILQAVARSLIKQGLLAGEAPDHLQITAAGLALDVTQHPAWKPLADRRTAWERDKC
jgi:hypothetical protein